MAKKNIVIIGGGSSALMLACSLDTNKFNISFYEKNYALGRKFLVAGKGGFNLTHAEDITQFAERYYPKEFIKPFLDHFSNTDFRDWLKSIEIDTYVGTSNRVFPLKGMKPIEVLRHIEKELEKNSVSIYYDYEWRGWENNTLVFFHNNKPQKVKADIVVFALGGASWKVTGSDGSWTNYFNDRGIDTKPFYPSNCAYEVNWEPTFIKAHHGQALKNCEFSCGSNKRKGEAILTQFGIEGSGIYPLSPQIRTQLVGHAELDSASLETLNQFQGDRTKVNSAKVFIDFKPDLSLEEITSRLENKGKSSVKEVLEKRINLSNVQIDLLKLASNKEQYSNPDFLSQLIKSYPLTLVGVAPLDDAISTVGGISLQEVNKNMELKKLPSHYCMGEMLDWDAPTGGYLLQACFSMGKFLANKLNAKE